MFVAGMVNHAPAAVVRFGAKAALGAELALEVDVIQLSEVPAITVLSQPAGRVGEVTPSKFCEADTTGVPKV
jgi:hypothetical protein